MVNKVVLLQKAEERFTSLLGQVALKMAEQYR